MEDYYYPVDKQQVAPVSHCRHCGGEIYGEDTCYLIRSEIICEDCLGNFEKETRCSMSGYELGAYLNHLYGGLDEID